MSSYMYTTSAIFIKIKKKRVLKIVRKQTNTLNLEKEAERKDEDMTGFKHTLKLHC